jgi:hypothetical protein
MKLGGEQIYAGPLGRHCSHLIHYFEVSRMYNSSNILVSLVLLAYSLSSLILYRLLKEFLKSKMVIILQHGCWKLHQQDQKQILRSTSLMYTETPNYTG